MITEDERVKRTRAGDLLLTAERIRAEVSTRKNDS